MSKATPRSRSSRNPIEPAPAIPPGAVRHGIRAGAIVALAAIAVVASPAHAQHASDPTAPHSLEAQSVTGGIALNWSAPTEDPGSVTGYEILRRRPGIDAVGSFHSIESTIGGSSTTYTDTTTEAGNSYTYRVKALRGAAKSAWSNYVRVDLPEPPPPTTTTTQPPVPDTATIEQSAPPPPPTKTTQPPVPGTATIEQSAPEPSPPPSPPATGPLTGFTLVDATDQTTLATISDDAALTLDDPDNASIGARVEVAAGATIGSVQLELTGPTTHTQTENWAPYSLYGDNGTALDGNPLPAGSYTLTATAYANRRLAGDVLGTLEVPFTVNTPPETTTTTQPPAPDPATLESLTPEPPPTTDGEDETDEDEDEDVCAVPETTHSERVSGGVYRIAYSSIGSGVGINVMSADGTGTKMITSHDADVSEPVWSPDSSKVTYIVKVGGDREVFVVGAGGTDTTRLTSDSRQNQWPSWSPDGTEIIFESAETMGGYSKIVSIGPDATARTDVFDSTTYRSPHIPQWSPDGRTIAVKAGRSIVLFDADGTDVTPVPETGRFVEEFAWSPDSTRIAYEQSGRIYVATVKTDSSTDNTDSGDDMAVALLTEGFEPTWSPDGTKILFVSWAHGHRDFFVIDSDGTDRAPLTSSRRAEYAASWSPDGTKIAFHAYPDGDSEIFVINSDGTGETRLTRNNDQDKNPVWSPDGTKIAYNSKPVDREIFVIDSDGTGKRQLTDNEVHDTSPDWSPDGTKIVFVTVDAGEGDGEIAVMDADGTNVVQLTDTAITEFQPIWSPDGTRIAYLTDDGADHEIAVMDADGTNKRQLTDNTVRDGDVRWSPDSTRLVYTTNDGDNEIAVIGVDGTNRQQLTSNDYLDEEPDWSPDGTRIAYTSMPTPGDFEVYTMNTDGTCPLRMTDGGEHSFRPRWSPDGEQLLYNYRLLWIRAIGLVDADGTDAQLVRGSGMNGLNPAWSPDGTRIVYEILGIATVDRAGGGNIRRLTYSGDDLEPAWSPVPNSTSGGDS